MKPQRTSTPLHALTTLNDPTYVEAARVWAAKLTELPDEMTRLKHAFHTASRPAEARDLESLQRILGTALIHFTHHKEEATKLLQVGEAKSKTNLSPSEHAAWTTVCLTLFNLDETLTR